MKILVVIPSLIAGGAEIFALRLAKAQQQTQQHQIWVYNAAYHYQSQLKEQKSPLLNNLQIIDFEPPKWFNILFKKIYLALYHKNPYYVAPLIKLADYYRQKHLKKTIQQIEPTLIHSHVWAADRLVVNTLKNTSKLPICISMHGSYEGNYKINPQRRRYVLERINAVGYAAQKNLQIFEKITLHNTQLLKKLIYYGFEPNTTQTPANPPITQQLSINNQAFIFAMTSRGDEPTKGWHETLQAFEHLQNLTTQPTHLILIGAGEHLTHLKKQYQHLNNVTWYGYSNNPTQIIQAAHVALLPTYFPTESLPNAIIEYLYCQKPVIATQWAENLNMIMATTQTPAGIIIQINKITQKPDIQQLTNAMLAYINSPELYQKHQKNTQIAFAQFDMKTCLQKYDELYKQIINQAT